MRKRASRDRRFWIRSRRRQARGEEGQAMLEMTICIIFLLLVVVALFEFAMVFYAYISLLNAAREGAVYASIWPDVRNGPSSSRWTDFVDTTTAEAEASGLDTTPGTFEIVPPVVDPVCGTDAGCPITCVLNYEMMNETQGLFLPLMGRLGLFQTLTISAQVEMPIRDDE